MVNIQDYRQRHSATVSYGMNNRPYASPKRRLPGKYTILANLVKNTPADGSADVTTLCNSVGKNARSMRAIISTAVARAYIEPIHPPHTTPQSYRLTPIGQLVKVALL